MIAKSLIRATLLATAMTMAAPVFAAGADPSIHEVYLAAEAGKFAEAQAMMDQVLRDHPNSGKAHFVEAELLAKQGKIAAAEAELNTADKLAPGLPGEKASAVANLRQLIASYHATPAQQSRPTAYARPPVVYTQSAPSHGSGLGGILLLVVLLGVFIVVVSRFMARRNAPTAYGPAAMGGGYGPGPVPGGYPGQMGAGYGQPMQGGGIGSGIVGGLATGAAVGAGIVAGEALMHHFTDGDRDRGNGNYQPQYEPPPVRDDRLANDDMGGSDFGSNDSSSWDDNSGGGGGDSGGDW